MTAPEDFLALEAPLVARLKSRLPAAVHVLAAKDLAQVADATQPTPAVHVLYRGYAPGASESVMNVDFAQRWLTVVAVRQLADLSGARAAREAAGPLLGTVIAALGAWVPDLPGYKSMQLDAAPEAGFLNGHGYFPIGWRVAMKVRADRSKP